MCGAGRGRGSAGSTSFNFVEEFKPVQTVNRRSCFGLRRIRRNSGPASRRQCHQPQRRWRRRSDLLSPTRKKRWLAWWCSSRKSSSRRRFRRRSRRRWWQTCGSYRESGGAVSVTLNNDAIRRARLSLSKWQLHQSSARSCARRPEDVPVDRRCRRGLRLRRSVLPRVVRARADGGPRRNPSATVGARVNPPTPVVLALGVTLPCLVVIFYLLKVRRRDEEVSSTFLGVSTSSGASSASATEVVLPAAATAHRPGADHLRRRSPVHAANGRKARPGHPACWPSRRAAGRPGRASGRSARRRVGRRQR